MQGAGGAVGTAEKLFASDSLQKAGLKSGAVNAETNAGTHGFARAMSEAADLNDWFNSDLVNADDSKARLHFRTASFCMGSSSGFDDWDQPMAMFLPNATWLEPPGAPAPALHYLRRLSCSSCLPQLPACLSYSQLV